MRPLRRRLAARRTRFSIALLVVAAACQGAQQGAYTPCDEPAGLALDCPVDPPDPGGFSTWEACEKLAACGVVLLQDDPSDPGPETPDPFAACVDQVQRAAQDLGTVILACIETTPCPDLQETLDDSDDPNAQNDNIEGIIGWCGRLDPR